MVSVCVCVCVVCACVRACVCVLCACVSVVSVIVKRPALPSCTVDGHSRNPLHYYYVTTWAGQATQPN